MLGGLRRSFTSSPHTTLKAYGGFFKNPFNTRVPEVPKAAVLDWSGTVADEKVCAPADAFIGSFKNFGITINNRQARKPMGNHKKVHIQKILEDPNVIGQCVKIFRKKPDDKLLNDIFIDYSKLQVELLTGPKYCKLLPGVVDTVNLMRSKYGLKIGSTSGFTREMHVPLMKYAKEQGYVPDVTVASDEVEPGRSRPKPDAIFKNMMLLGIDNTASVLKVGDTKLDSGESYNAGTITVALAENNNFVGEQFDNIDDIKKLSKDAYRELMRASANHLLEEYNPNYVVDNITKVPLVIEDILKTCEQRKKKVVYLTSFM